MEAFRVASLEPFLESFDQGSEVRDVGVQESEPRGQQQPGSREESPTVCSRGLGLLGCSPPRNHDDSIVQVTAQRL